RIVVRVVVRAQPGRTIVLAARRQRRAMERFDLPAIPGPERQVKMRRLLLGWADAQRRFPVRTELDTERPFQDDSYADRVQRLEEERLARCIVGDSEYDVVKHELSR